MTRVKAPWEVRLAARLISAAEFNPVEGRRGGGRSYGGRFFFGWAAAVLSAALLLGGGTQVGLVADAIVQMMSLPLIAMSLMRIGLDRGYRALRAALVAPFAIVVCITAQLVPMPVVAWANIPGRQFIYQNFTALDIIPSWLPISLSPHVTVYSIFSVLPAIAIFLAAVTLDEGRLRWLMALALIFGTVNVLVGLTQLGRVSGNSPSDVIDVVNYSAVGLFANRNHFSALVYMTIPIAIEGCVAALLSSYGKKAFIAGAHLSILSILLVGLLIAYSRAGIFLGFVSVISSCIFILTIPMSRRRVSAAIFVAAFLLIGLIVMAGFVGLLKDRSVHDAARAYIATTSFAALKDNVLLGTGFGTFVPVYMTLEPIRDVSVTYANHAHNDWLEVAIEGGLPAIALMIAFVGWCVWSIARVWRPLPRLPHGGIALARAASISVVLVLLHSVVDYPLRTTALMSLFGLLCATLFVAAIAGRTADAAVVD